jgi:Protein of unknown function (DUF3108)
MRPVSIMRVSPLTACALAGIFALATVRTAVARDDTALPGSADSALAFSAHYDAAWKGINVGTSNIELKPAAEPGRFIYTWTITARGIFRLAYSDDVVQTSWLKLDGQHVRPERYRGREGAATVELNFDWLNKHASGESEKKPVDIKLKEGTQDVLSIQVEVMLDLKNGNLPKTFQIVDKDQLKEFNYTQEGTARIRTALGELDTVMVSSQRAGNNRILRMWFAPSLGFVPVQAERSRDGKVEIAMHIKSLQRQGQAGVPN